MSKSNAKSAPAARAASIDPSERRKSRRRPILDTFSLFLVVPKKGAHRLPIHDISNEGIGFSLDTEGESPDQFALAAGEVIQLRLYLNQTLYLPLAVKTARIETVGGVRRVGAAFEDTASKSFRAFQAFNQMLDQVADVAHIDPSTI